MWTCCDPFSGMVWGPIVFYDSDPIDILTSWDQETLKAVVPATSWYPRQLYSSTELQLTTLEHPTLQVGQNRPRVCPVHSSTYCQGNSPPGNHPVEAGAQLIAWWPQWLQTQYITASQHRVCVTLRSHFFQLPDMWAGSIEPWLKVLLLQTIVESLNPSFQTRYMVWEWDYKSTM